MFSERTRSWLGLCLVASCLGVLVLVGCQTGDGAPARAGAPPVAEPPAAAPPTAAQPIDTTPAQSAQPYPGSRPLGPAPAAKRVSSFDREPLIGVFLASGTSVSLRLLHNGSGLVDGHHVAFAAGTLTFHLVGEDLRCDATGGRKLGDDVVIQMTASGATFSAVLDPPFGKPTQLRLAGNPVLHIDRSSRKVQLIEQVPLETYLAGVLAGEVNPKWPLEALKAQAIVARSYATDRYLQNADQPWQLHWHFTVDMSYAGWATLPESIASALDQTRGEVLLYHHLPVPALFHACSGGRTESALHFRPDLKGADGVTDMTVVMPSVSDPSAIPGAMALGYAHSHVHWHAQLTLAAVTTALHHWYAGHPQDRTAIGTVDDVRVVNRYSDSGRVAEVLIRHHVGDRSAQAHMTAADFRLAVGPGQIRSTDWSSCQVDDGVLVISGHGYGHGVGMSQVSAFQMARTGQTSDEILSLFYPGATLTRCWR